MQKKKQDINVTYTTGDPAINAAQFNKDATCADAVGLCAENLTEDKMVATRLGIEVELPAHTHLVEAAQIKHAVRKLEPEEEFEVGYVTPIYFYKELWDKFTLFKYTEMTGWTGEDYIEARASNTNSASRIELAKQQTATADLNNEENHSYNDGGSHADRNPLANHVSDFSARYTLVNKIVDQGKGETLLFYPVVGSKPHIVYYIDLKNGQGPMPVSREDLVPTVYKKTLELASKRSEAVREKVQHMLDIDAATISATEFDDEVRRETRARFGNGHVAKPQVRALYLNQIYYLKTKDTTLGAKDANQFMQTMPESLSHELTEKRETKRYYIRPQNIFCANKADVLKGLISVAESGENCTVYSLKNLDDHDDVHQLTNHDIIYYYDDNVLYDKNHVLVMDYDLFIKHEEERKKINRNPDTITKQEYDKYYDDRMTKETVTEATSLKKTSSRAQLCDITEVYDESTGQPISVDTFRLAIERGEKVDVGTSAADVLSTRTMGATYYSTSYIAYKDNEKYCLESVLIDYDGKIIESNLKTFDSMDELINALLAVDWTTGNCRINLHVDEQDNPFETSFDDYDVFGNRLTEAKQSEVDEFCCICGEPIEGYSNNAEPYKEGRCCDACNMKFVIPARLNIVSMHNTDEE